MNYYSHNIGDYAQAASHLSLVEDAVYSRLLRRYYSEEMPLIDDMAQLCRWVGARSEEEKEAVEVVIKEFFELCDGYWHNKRADREIEAYQEKSAKASESAAKRWQAKEPATKKPSKSERNATAMPTHTEPNANQEPITNNQYKEKTNKKENSNSITPADSPCVVSDFSDFVESPPEPAENPRPENPVSTAGAIATYCRSQGINGNPSHQLKQLVEQGAQMSHFVDAIPITKQAGKGFPYLLGIVKNMLTDPPRARASPANSSHSGKFDPVAYVNQGRIQHDPSIIDI